MSDLAKRLEIKASVIEMGEQIAWGSDTALMREAAEAIRNYRARVAELESLLGASREWVEERLETQRRAYHGYEGKSSIAALESLLAAIDRDALEGHDDIPCGG